LQCVLVFGRGCASRNMNPDAKKRGAEYSFLFVHPDGSQLAEIGELLELGRIPSVIDKVFPFDQAKEALAYLEKGRAKGKVVVQNEEQQQRPALQKTSEPLDALGVRQ